MQYYYDSEEGCLFTTAFENSKDGSVREYVVDRIYPYEAGWKWLDVSQVFNPTFRAFFYDKRLV